MGNEMKNVARGFKFLWATFSKIMGNVFSRHGQCFLSLSVGYACYPWVTPIVRGLRLSASPTAVCLPPRCGLGYPCGLKVQQDRSPGQSEATPRVAQCLYLLRPAGAKG